jgi:hypothetical protein
LSIAAPQVIALRTARMAAGEYGDGREVWRMGTEKVQALHEATQGVALQLFRANAEWPLVAMRQWWLFWQRVWLWPFFGAARTPLPVLGSAAARKHLRKSMTAMIDQGLAPAHRRVTGNLKRLSRAKKR